jgi:hypothetical protein
MSAAPRAPVDVAINKLIDAAHTKFPGVLHVHYETTRSMTALEQVKKLVSLGFAPRMIAVRRFNALAAHLT